MDNGTFASYKFKPSDVIEGLNRYFTETKVNRYLRVPLEIRNGVWTSNPDYRKDIVFTNSPPDQRTRSGHVCKHYTQAYGSWKYYLICDPEEVVGVAINWLREEHDIFYTPGMNEPPIKDPDDIFRMENLKETKNFSITIDDFCVDDAAKEYEKASRRDLIEALQRRLYEAKRRIVALEEGHKEKTKIIDRQVAMIKELEEQLREANEELSNHRVAEGWLRKDNSDLAIDVANLKEQLRVLRYDILKVYREIFDCSNGDPEGTDEEVMQDILTEYKRVLELKNVAEEKTIKYKELARENEDTAKENKVQWNNTKAQLQWAQKENLEWLKRYEQLKSELNEMKTLYCGAAVGNGSLCADLAKEKEWTKRLEQIKKERDELKEKYEQLYMSYEKTYRTKFNKLSEERDRYKWLYENLKNGVESVLQEAEEKED